MASAVESKEIVVVTGGSGFLGQHIVKQLLEQEDFPISEIRVFDVVPLLWHIGLDVTEDTENSTKLYRGDLCSLPDVQAAFKGATVVIHNASIVDVTSLPDINKIYRVNVLGTHNVIKACVDNNIRILVYTSSGSVVSKLGYYGSCKAEAEHMVLQANSRELSNGCQLSTCALRLPALYGEGGTDMLGSLRRNIFWNMFMRSGGEDSNFPTAYAGNMAHAFVCAVRQLRKNDDVKVLGNKMEPAIKITLSGDTIPFNLVQKSASLPRTELVEIDAEAKTEGNPAGRAISVIDDTPVTSYCEFLGPFLQMLKVAQSFFIIPWSVLYALAFVCDWLSHLLQPFLTLQLPLSKVAVDHMHLLPVFNNADAKLYLKYESIYSYKDSLRRTFKYIEQKMK